MMEPSGDLWVFGYGSLMWRPGFPFVEQSHAHLFGYHRALCIRSHVHRGTPERPGLVLGLDRGGRCHGVAFRVPDGEVEATIRYLREREQATAVYLERHLPVRLPDGRTVPALAYVADRKHPQYAGRLAFEDVVQIVRGGRGISGENPDYVRSTYEHLLGMGVVDPLLRQVTEAIATAP
ncbi:gamma-glutamylcyclotransferase [Microvirga antarctica]|uniref:gamma-glutamylcyclotransferase n=1 Tax=Microvirga antarctica TaxID=2819233 RepID=UPI001B300383|nr:gamma-glutamylcyclotransferase [Microvirga antarctica]